MNEHEAYPDLSTDHAADAYFKDAAERIKNGETVWVQRTFTTDFGGRVLDLYAGRRHVGLVDSDEGMCQAYVDGKRSGGILPLMEAALVVEAAIENRG